MEAEEFGVKLKGGITPRRLRKTSNPNIRDIPVS